MTEKRFVFVGSGIEDNLENESYLYNKDGFQDVCECLNNLHEENKRLQGRIQEYEEIIGGYIDENEEIRKKVNALHEENQHLRELLDIGKTNAKAIIDVLNEQEQYKILTNSLKEQNQKLKLRLKDLGVEYY